MAEDEGGLWSIVLAGGEGERLRAWTEQRFGEARPKQYCVLMGQRTMLEHTLERAVAVSGPGRVVTVIGSGHLRYLAQPRRVELPGRVIEEPARRDTAPGVLLPLTYVLAADPGATVALLPSDHYIAPAARFQEHLASAFRLASAEPTRVVLLAAVPDRPEPDYGWIQAGSSLDVPDADVRFVRTFREKPSVPLASQFFREGYLWNTFILVAKARTLWDLAGEHVPHIRSRFEALLRAVGTPYEEGVLDWTYGAMKPANFSSLVLERAADRILVMKLEGVEWNDWGRPERIEETLRRLGPPPVIEAPPAGEPPGAWGAFTPRPA